MTAEKLQVEADSDNLMMRSETMSADSDNLMMRSEIMSTTTQSSIENQGGGNKEITTEAEKKMKKLRSIKLYRMPSTRKGRSSSCVKLSGYAASSEQSTPIQMSDASPNHINATSFSDAKEENFQGLPVTSTRESSFKLVRSVTRKSSMKFRRSQIKLKKSSSRREVNPQDDQNSIIQSSEVDSSPHYLKATSSSDMKKEQLQASKCHSESSFDSSEEDKEILTNEIQHLAYSGNKSIRFLRTSTLGPMRILTKMASLKSKRPSTKKCSKSSSISDPTIERATCSSTLKHSKFPDHVEINTEETGFDRTAVSNVCRYSYCSLHGHHHSNKPPLKRFVSMRRRVGKSQRSLKQDRQSSGKEKHSGTRKKGIQTEKRVLNGDLGVDVQQTTADIREIPSVPGKEGIDFVNLIQTVPTESSYSNPSDEGTLQVSRGRSFDCNVIGTEQYEAIFGAARTKIKTEEIVRITPHNGEHMSIDNVVRPKRDASSQEFQDPTQFGKLSLKPDETISICTERLPVEEEACRHLDKASSLNLEENKGQAGNNVKILETVSTAVSCELPHGLSSSASVSGMGEEPALASEENNEDAEQDHGILQPAMAASSTDVTGKAEIENQKNFTFWKFIYQQMVTGLDTDLETQKPLPGMNLEEKVENLSNAHEKNDSCQEILQTNQAMNAEDQEARNQKLEFSQTDVIMLVQQAFDKILSEIPDQSSADQSIASDVTSDQEFLLEKHDEGKKVSISTSSNSIENCMKQDQEETRLQTDKNIGSEEVKAAQMGRKKSDKQMPSSWSNLKKIIILNRFVKSLEKVRNLKPRTTRYIPMDKDQEAEKIQLRHQNMKGRKNAEEWMLDHALRQVISTLAPSQKRKVAMLVQAFESVITVPENGDNMRSSAAVSSPTTSVQAYNESLVHNGDSVKKKNGAEILAGKAYLDQVRESHKAYQQIPKSSFESQETSLLCVCTEEPLCTAGSEMTGTDMKKEDTGAVNGNNGKEFSIAMDVQPKLVDLSLPELEEPRLSDKSLTSEGVVRTPHEKSFAVNEEVVKRVSKEQTPIIDSDICNEGSEFSKMKMDLGSSDLTNSADQDPGKSECPTEVGGVGTRPNHKFLRSPFKQSESNFSADISKAERQKYTRLWYLIYKHMVSGSVTENGLQPLQNVAAEEQQGDNAIKQFRDNNANSQGSFAAGQDMMQNYIIGSQNIEFHNNEIVKLVEEAIDEIPLPETQDDTSDNQSVTSDVTPDVELPEKRNGEEDAKFILSSTDSSKENTDEARNITAELCSTLNSEEKQLKFENMSTQQEAKRGTEKGNRSKNRVQRNWSNLKKLILLRRFVKALEKVKEFNLRGPRYLSLDPTPEPEKVLLRHQNMEDRKNAEDWMLDHALQQVVTKLTPERKRRVQLLVEAFETVIPTIS